MSVCACFGHILKAAAAAAAAHCAWFPWAGAKKKKTIVEETRENRCLFHPGNDLFGWRRKENK